MSGGDGSRRMRGFPNPPRPDDHHRVPDTSNGAPIYPRKTAKVGDVKVTRTGIDAVRQVSRPPDELERSGVTTWASERRDHYTDRGPSWAGSGPQSPRASRSYEDR